MPSLVRGTKLALALWLALCAEGTAVRSVRADESTNDALAYSLFQEGDRLFSQGKFAAACDKLAESRRLVAKGGTLMLLAECYEKVQRSASALLVYDEALARAVTDKRPDREAHCRARIAHLRTVVGRLRLKVRPDAPSTLVVRIGTTVLPRAAWDSIALDAGEHVVEVRAEGYTPHQGSVRVRDGAEAEYLVPALSRLPVAIGSSSVAPPSSVPTAPPSVFVPPSRSGPPVSAWVLFGVGGASLLAAGVTGALSLPLRTECPTTGCTSSEISAARSRYAFAWASTITLGVGVLTSAIGGLLWALDKRGPVRPEVSWAPGQALFSVRMDIR